MIDWYNVRNSHLTLLGRIVVILLSAVLVFINYQALKGLADPDANEILVFVGCLIIAGIACVALGFVWAAIAFVINALRWMLTGSGNYDEIFLWPLEPLDKIVTGYKLIFGDWRKRL